jgi:hypothetical protein
MSTFIIKFLFIFFVFFELSNANELPVLDLPEEFDSSWISQNMDIWTDEDLSKAISKIQDEIRADLLSGNVLLCKKGCEPTIWK